MCAVWEHVYIYKNLFIFKNMLISIALFIMINFKFYVIKSYGQNKFQTIYFEKHKCSLELIQFFFQKGYILKRFFTVVIKVLEKELRYIWKNFHPAYGTIIYQSNLFMKIPSLWK